MFPPARQRLPEGDAAIRATDSDAAVARLSAVQKGYLTDPFIKQFVPRAHLQQPRPPLINVGTYVRSEGMDKLVNEWLELSRHEGIQCQIVSMGAGSDTRFWRIATGPFKDVVAKYIEVDFVENTTKKAMAIRKSKQLSAVLGQPEEVSLANGGAALHSPVYHLLPADLRVPPAESLGPLLTADPSLLSPSKPTLLLFECVLAYMSPKAGNAIMHWFTAHFSARGEGNGAVLGCIVYEMFALEDSFGKVMVNNLSARNVTLPGVQPYPTLTSLADRFLQHGWQVSRAVTLKDIRREYVEDSELQRISYLEMLDEIEELELVLAHYAITWGAKLPPHATALKTKWSDWGLKRKTIDTGDEYMRVE